MHNSISWASQRWSRARVQSVVRWCFSALLLRVLRRIKGTEERNLCFPGNVVWLSTWRSGVVVMVGMSLAARAAWTRYYAKTKVQWPLTIVKLVNYAFKLSHFLINFHIYTGVSVLLWKWRWKIRVVPARVCWYHLVKIEPLRKLSGL